MDVRDQKSVDAGIGRIVDRFGKIDIVVNNAGIAGVTPIDAPQTEAWLDIIQTNVLGSYYVTRAAAPHMSNGGRVIIISSVLGKFGVPGYTAYCTSKGATDALTRVHATEWAQYGITVIAIALTTFRSKLTEWMWKDDEVGKATRTRTLSRIPLGRLGEAEDLLGMALYLLAPASNFCTGQVMYVDGGFTAG